MSHINIQEGSKMNIIVHEESKQFHLCNDYISYVMYVQPNGELGQLYFGKKIHDREDFSHLVNCCLMAVTPYYDESTFFSLEKNRQEYPSFGMGDFGTSAFKIIDQNGSGVSCFKYVTYSISSVKKKLPGLPATYADEGEALSLEIELKDDVNELKEKVAAILARIQSITYMPLFTDGKASVDYSYDGTIVPGVAVFDFVSAVFSFFYLCTRESKRV